MTITAINPGSQVQTIDSTKANSAIQVQNNSEGKVVSFSQDQVNFSVKKGVLPTFKGVGVGIVGGAVGGAAAATAVLLPAIIHGGEGAAWATLGVVTAGAIGAIPGAIVGGVVANVTDNKLAGTLAGAGAGAVTGAIWGITQGNVVVSAIIGAGAGAGAGFAGALVATKK